MIYRTWCLNSIFISRYLCHNGFIYTGMNIERTAERNYRSREYIISFIKRFSVFRINRSPWLFEFYKTSECNSCYYVTDFKTVTLDNRCVVM